MQVKLNCASEGKHPNGERCQYFEVNTLSCQYQQTCMYHIHAAISQADVVRSEIVQQPQPIAEHMEAIRRGKDRIAELWSSEVFQTLAYAMSIVAKYMPGMQGFNEAHLDNPEGMQRDIIYLTSLNTGISVAWGQAEASHKQLDLWRHQLRAEKYQAIRSNYLAGLRRGKFTEGRLEMDVRADPEYREAQDTVVEAQRQATIFRNYSNAAIELVNALKKRIDSYRVEDKYSGTRSGNA